MKVRSAIARMSPYSPPLEARALGNYLLLDFNESTVPPSADAIAAIEGYLQHGRVHAYPAYGDILGALGRYTGCAPEQLILTNGCDQAIEIVMRAVVEPGAQVITAVPTFAMTTQVAQTLDARITAIPYPADLRYPLDAVIAAAGARTGLIVITNPNNPTGSSIDEARLRRLLAAHPGVPVMVDEAYFEFSLRTFAPLLGEFDNLAITRTFSKAFALAGLRLGYVMSNPAFVKELYKVRGPYDVNVLAVKAAEALLAHPEPWQAYVRDVMQVAKPRVERFFKEHGVRYFPGDANFLLVQPAAVASAVEYLRTHMILVRTMRPPVEHCFRVSIGSSADMARFMEVYAAYLAQEHG